MIDRLKKDECCGCNACGDICPKGSISFQKDEEGFLNPVIDHQTCVNCGLCEKVCPSINSEAFKKNNFEKPVCFAAIHKNLEVRFDSTSGGAFSALAKKAYLQGYYVGGAIWNADWSVSHYISNNKKDLEKLRSSKYIQSDSRGIYKQVKTLLEQGEKVLICGTPCQISGLKSYLRKDYKNLVTIDFVCQYVNSPLIWKKYIDYLENDHGSKVVYIKDKNKEIGWRSLCNKVVFENGDVIYDSYSVNHFRRCYMQLGIASRPSCYKCKFKGFPRVADITIADFWGVEKYLPKEYDNNLGTSLIMCNSQRGMEYFDEKVRKFLEVMPIDLENTLGKNPALSTSFHPDIKFKREDFYADLQKSDIKTVVDEYIEKYKGNQITTRRKIKNILKFLKSIVKSSGIHPLTFCKNLYYNLLCSNIKTSLSEGKYLILYPYCLFNLAKTAKINVGGVVKIGENFFKHEAKYTKVLMRNNSFIDFQGNYSFFSGCDIQVFDRATLTIEGGGDTNMNVEIVCGNHITFQKHVFIGRNVVIRDTNGQHFISRQGYKTSRPIILGTHAWICDRATIMPGVHIKPGGIVGANSYVTSNVEAFTMVTGNPVRVVDEEVYWKA